MWRLEDKQVFIRLVKYFSSKIRAFKWDYKMWLGLGINKLLHFLIKLINSASENEIYYCNLRTVLFKK